MRFIKLQSLLMMFIFLPMAMYASGEKGIVSTADIPFLEWIQKNNEPRNPAPCTPKFGEDSTKALDEISLYVEPFRQNNYDDAIRHWRYVFFNAPGSYEAVHTAGVRMYQHFLNQEQDPEIKDAMVDTLIMIYNKRIECFGNEGFVLGRKGADLMRYRPQAQELIKETLTRSMDLMGDNTEFFILHPIIRYYSNDFRRNNVSEEEMWKLYDRIQGIVKANEDGQFGEEYLQMIVHLDEEYTAIGLMDCDKLKEIYKARYKANPDDQDIWADAHSKLSNCSDCEPVFHEMYKKLFEVQPSADLAIKISSCETNIGTVSKALQYLDKAIDLVVDNNEKARLAYNAAVISYRDLNNFSRARTYANRAISFRPNWGDPYLLIGDMYAASGSLCGPGTGFQSQVVVWPAIDKWEQAKSVDPSVRSQADRKINEFSKYMPSREDLFNREIEPGSEYSVGCWINETTIVRAAPRN